MTVSEYRQIRAQVLSHAEWRKDYDWFQTLKLCDSAAKFFVEYCFVVCNSGMCSTTAVRIFNRVLETVYNDKSASTALKHTHKAHSIDFVYANRAIFFEKFTAAEDKIAFLETLPHIGAITKYHLAKNLGIDCAKPDRWLVKYSKSIGTNTHALCEKLSRETDDRIATVDYVLWRALSQGILRIHSAQA